jgi:hypothetical protein
VARGEIRVDDAICGVWGRLSNGSALHIAQTWHRGHSWKNRTKRRLDRSLVYNAQCPADECLLAWCLNAFGRGWVLGQRLADPLTKHVNIVTSTADKKIRGTLNLGLCKHENQISAPYRPVAFGNQRPESVVMQLTENINLPRGCCFRRLCQSCMLRRHRPCCRLKQEMRGGSRLTVGVALGAQAALKPRLTLPISLRGCNTHQHNFQTRKPPCLGTDQREPSSRISFTRVSAHPSIHPQWKSGTCSPV